MQFPRFFLAKQNWPAPGESLTLEGDEAHHCQRVLRCQIGDRVEVFDGEGGSVFGTIQSSSRGQVNVSPSSTQQLSPAPRTRLILAQAVPKGKNMDLVIQKGTELGVNEVIPLETANTIVKFHDDAERAKRSDKWQRVALEACKQCGQNFLPKIHQPITFHQFLHSIHAVPLRTIGSLAPGAKTFKSLLADLRPSPPAAVITIGPEGDFTPEETNAALAAGFFPLDFGPIVLRTETAAIFALSILRHELVLSPS